MNYTVGVELLADFTGGQVRILRATRLDHVPRLCARHPQLIDEAHVPPGGEEVTLTILDERGASVGSGAYDTRAIRYVDWYDPKTGALTGGPRYIRPDELDLRTLRVPLPDEGWLNFHRTEVVHDGFKFARRRTSLGLFDAGTGLGRSAPIFQDRQLPTPSRVTPLPWAPRVTRDAGGGIRHLTPFEPSAGASVFPGVPPDYAGGAIVGTETLEYHGDKRFNIVITGDGFQENELRKFNELAKRLHRRFRTMQPFKSVWNLINWHVVQAASTDSGVLHCPDSTPKETFYQTEGCWWGAPVPGFIGTGEEGLKLIRWAAEQVAPPEQIGVIIVIANCRYYGGHGWPDQKMVFLSACWDRPRLFVGMAAHECAHAIGNIGEEYISLPQEGAEGVPKIPDHLGPNIASLAEVSASVRKRLLERAPELVDLASAWPPPPSDSIWWQKLARTHELSKDGKSFLAAHVLGDHMDGVRPRLKPSSREKRLGVFWGGQAVVDDIDDVWRAYRELLGLPADAGKEVRDRLWRELRLPSEGDTGGSDVWHEPRGAVYFRPMGVCRMRQVTYQFCRVCCHVLKNRIRELCGEPAEEPYAPGP